MLLLRIRLLRALAACRHKLMYNRKIPCARIHTRLFKKNTHRIVIAANLLLRPGISDKRGMDIRNQIDVDCPVIIRNPDRMEDPVETGRDVDLTLPEKPPRIRDPLRGIMIPADQKNHNAKLRQSHQKIIKQIHRLCRWYRLVINIPRNDHRVCRGLLRPFQNLLQNVPLILQHRKTVDPLADVKV